MPGTRAAKVFLAVVYLILSQQVAAQSEEDSTQTVAGNVLCITGSVVGRDCGVGKYGRLYVTDLTNYSDISVELNNNGEFNFCINNYTKPQLKRTTFKLEYFRSSEYYRLTKQKIRLYKYRQKPLLLKYVDQRKNGKYYLKKINDALFDTVLPSFALNIGKEIFGSIGITFSPSMTWSGGGFAAVGRNENLESNFYITAATEVNFRSNPFILGPKLGIHYRYYSLLESGINTIAYTDFNNTAYFIRPETGVSLLGYMGFYYGYNIRIDKGTALESYLNTHQFTAFLRVMLK